MKSYLSRRKHFSLSSAPTSRNFSLKWFKEHKAGETSIAHNIPVEHGFTENNI